MVVNVTYLFTHYENWLPELIGPINLAYGADRTFRTGPQEICKQ